MNGVITYHSPNGYSGKLKAWHSIDRGPAVALWVFGPDGHRVLHSGYSNLRTEEQLKECVDNFPKFLESLSKLENMKEETDGICNDLNEDR